MIDAAEETVFFLVIPSGAREPYSRPNIELKLMPSATWKIVSDPAFAKNVGGLQKNAVSKAKSGVSAAGGRRKLPCSGNKRQII